MRPSGTPLPELLSERNSRMCSPCRRSNPDPARRLRLAAGIRLCSLCPGYLITSAPAQSWCCCIHADNHAAAVARIAGRSGLCLPLELAPGQDRLRQIRRGPGRISAGHPSPPTENQCCMSQHQGLRTTGRPAGRWAFDARKMVMDIFAVSTWAGGRTRKSPLPDQWNIHRRRHAA